MGSSHTPNLASSDQNLWYSLYLLLVLVKQAPALPLNHEGGFSMMHGVRRQCGQALSPPKDGGSSPSPSYPFSPSIIINFNFKSLYLLLLGFLPLLPPPLMPLARLCEGPGAGIGLASAMEVAAAGLLVVRIISSPLPAMTCLTASST